MKLVTQHKQRKRKAKVRKALDSATLKRMGIDDGIQRAIRGLRRNVALVVPPCEAEELTLP